MSEQFVTLRYSFHKTITLYNMLVSDLFKSVQVYSSNFIVFDALKLRDSKSGRKRTPESNPFGPQSIMI